MENPNNLMTRNEFNWSKMIQKKQQMVFLHEQLNWGTFFKSMMSGKWRDSLKDYLVALDNFRQITKKNKEIELRDGVKMNLSELKYAKEKYKGERKRHLEFSQTVIPSEYYRLTTESLDVQFKALDLEIQSETGSQFGHEQGGETLEEISPKLSIAPEIAAKFGISEYSRSSELFEDRLHIKAHPSEKLKIQEIMKYYSQRERDYNSISGLIGSFGE